MGMHVGTRSRARVALPVQVGNHCAERGALLQRLRKFYQLAVTAERECRDDLRAANEELRAAEASQLVERQRADRLHAECTAARDKIEALRASMVRASRRRHGRAARASSSLMRTAWPVSFARDARAACANGGVCTQVRLKMLRAIHGRKLAAADMRINEMEREATELQEQVKIPPRSPHHPPARRALGRRRSPRAVGARARTASASA